MKMSQKEMKNPQKLLSEGEKKKGKQKAKETQGPVRRYLTEGVPEGEMKEWGKKKKIEEIMAENT